MSTPPLSRPQALWRWLRKHQWRTLATLLLLAFGTLNLWTYQHAWSMTHFSSGGNSTLRPEQLSGLAKAGVLLTGVNLPRPTNDRTPGDLGLAYSVHMIPVTEGIELEAWYVPHAQPHTMVCLFHGYGSGKDRLLNEAQEFHNLGCSTLLVDFRGSGGSSGNTTTLGVYEGADVASACRFARGEAPGVPLVLFGRSMGSVAILRAIAHDDVQPAGIIIECPFDRLLGTVRHRFAAMRLPSFPCAELLVFWGGVQHGMNGFAHNPVDYATRVTCPSLIMHGDDDQRVDVSEVQAVVNALSGEKQFEIFPEVGHESCYRTRPDLWTSHVAEFLERHAE
ncbi:MAG: alpha/beta fold hydrolase [Planctomycetaceae bacterium]|nr:alpha/beta fold hydrolase [Planctomycetaceae bacterium]